MCVAPLSVGNPRTWMNVEPTLTVSNQMWKMTGGDMDEKEILLNSGSDISPSSQCWVSWVGFHLNRLHYIIMGLKTDIIWSHLAPVLSWQPWQWYKYQNSDWSDWMVWIVWIALFGRICITARMLRCNVCGEERSKRSWTPSQHQARKCVLLRWNCCRLCDPWNFYTKSSDIRAAYAQLFLVFCFSFFALAKSCSMSFSCCVLAETLV